MELTKRDKMRLQQFNPSGMTDGLFDRNFANKMEDLGLIKYITGCLSGERFYDITEDGIEILKCK